MFRKRGKAGYDPGKSAFGGHDPMQGMPFRHMPLKPNEAEQALLDRELMSAVVMGDLRQVRASLSRGADAKAWDGGGMTPLMVAAMNGRTDIGEALLEAKADPLAKISIGMYEGMDAMAFARMHGQRRFCKMLQGYMAGPGGAAGRLRDG